MALFFTVTLSSAKSWGTMILLKFEQFYIYWGKTWQRTKAGIETETDTNY